MKSCSSAKGVEAHNADFEVDSKWVPGACPKRDHIAFESAITAGDCSSGVAEIAR